MNKYIAVLALTIAFDASAESIINDYRTDTVITPQANYVVTTTPKTTYVVGPTGTGAPITITPSTTTRTYITPTGTYMSIPNGSTTTILKVSGARK